MQHTEDDALATAFASVAPFAQRLARGLACAGPYIYGDDNDLGPAAAMYPKLCLKAGVVTPDFVAYLQPTFRSVNEITCEWFLEITYTPANGYAVGDNRPKWITVMKDVRGDWRHVVRPGTVLTDALQWECSTATVQFKVTPIPNCMIIAAHQHQWEKSRGLAFVSVRPAPKMTARSRKRVYCQDEDDSDCGLSSSAPTTPRMAS